MVTTTTEEKGDQDEPEVLRAKTLGKVLLACSRPLLSSGKRIAETKAMRTPMAYKRFEQIHDLGHVVGKQLSCRRYSGAWV
jgi:hypothetical protein